LVDTNFTMIIPFAFVPDSPTVIVGRVAARDDVKSFALWDFSANKNCSRWQRRGVTYGNWSSRLMEAGCWAVTGRATS
jgi:hypothetical protein